MTRRGLGRGLDALISNTQPQGGAPGDEAAEVTSVASLDEIEPNPYQPRHAISDAELGELAASIREHGLIQPLVVRRDPETGILTLIAGERRWRAARIAGLERVPVVAREATDQQMLALAIIENVQRSDLNPIEAAEGFRRLMEAFGLTQAEVARLIGKSRPAVTNTLRLLTLPESIRDQIASGELSEGHGRALLALGTAEEQLRLARRAVTGGWPVRRLEQEARQEVAAAESQTASTEVRKTAAADPNTQAAVRALEESLGTRVEIRRRGDGGQVVVHFYSEEELTALYDRLVGPS